VAESKDLDDNVVMVMIIFFMLVDTSHVLVVSKLYYIYDLIIVVCLSIDSIQTLSISTKHVDDRQRIDGHLLQ